MMKSLLAKVRPNIFLAITLLGAISGFLIFQGAVEGAVGLAGSIAMLAKEVILNDSDGKE